jgi:hypothetical protein
VGALVTTTDVNPKDQAKFIHAYLSQGEVWFPKDRPKIRIKDMDLDHRRNAANWLVRRAASWSFMYTVGEVSYLMSGCNGLWREVVSDGDGNPVPGPAVSMMPSGDMACDAYESEQMARQIDPAAWIQTTALYRALVAGAGDDE